MAILTATGVYGNLRVCFDELLRCLLESFSRRESAARARSIPFILNWELGMGRHSVRMVRIGILTILVTGQSAPRRRAWGILYWMGITRSACPMATTTSIWPIMETAP